VLVEHEGRRPVVAASAYIAPTAVVSGDVTVGEDARILFGAVVTADGGPIEIGRQCIVMENALIRGRRDHTARIDDYVIVGPHAHVNGAEIDESAFLATGVSVFPGARVGARAEIRINGVVHVNTVVPEDGLVPIGWVAVGDPAQVFPPDKHDEIWAIQEKLDFPRTVFGVERLAEGTLQDLQPEITRRYAALFARHRDDRLVD
jgi:gamma-carbonic anhydrase